MHQAPELMSHLLAGPLELRIHCQLWNNGTLEMGGIALAMLE